MKHIIALIFFLALTHSSSCQVYGIILAGGSGERMWPLSKIDTPKQLLSFDGKTTFLNQAINQIKQVIPQENILVCTTQAHEEKIKAHIDKSIKIIVEPAKRDTGPAILYSCMHIQQNDPDAIVLFFSSDHYIPPSDDELFAHSIQTGIDFICSHDQIVLFGLKPTHITTEYGYIEFDQTTNHKAPYKITGFYEKPLLQQAESFIARGMLWNQCMFGAQVSVFVNEFKKYAPDIVEAMHNYIHGHASYEEIRKISVDFAIMEKSEKLWVIPCEYSFTDIGSIENFLALKNQLGLLNGTVVDYHSHNNLVDVPDNVAVLLGVENLCVVKVGDIIFIGNKNKLRAMRDLITIIKKDEIMRKYL